MRSDNVTKGVQQAPHRSLMNALGMTEEEKNRPLIGIVNSYNEIVPGHMNLDKITEAVKLGVAMAGGTPVVFPAIAVCDGIAMGHVGMKYSLVTRDLICDSTECMAMAHQFDGLVCIPNCDKNVPGLLMAAARLNVPSIVLTCGYQLGGQCMAGEFVDIDDVYEAIGAVACGSKTFEELVDMTNHAITTPGVCAGLGTANSMHIVAEGLGMALPGNAPILADSAKLYRYCELVGKRIVEMVENDEKPRNIITKEAIENAIMVVLAIGGSVNRKTPFRNRNRGRNRHGCSKDLREICGHHSSSDCCKTEWSVQNRGSGSSRRMPCRHETSGEISASGCHDRIRKDGW